MASTNAPAGPSTGRHERLRWASAGLTVGALGLESADPLFAPSADSLPRLEVLERIPHRTRLCFALPGSPDARGNLTGRPGPLGTGLLWLTVYRGDVGEHLRARFTSPRSASLAEREWNLLCHLRAHGVGTPEPLLVGARGAGLFAAHSFLLVRAPEGAFPLPRWLRTDGIGAERERGLESLARALASLRRSNVELARLRAEHLWLTPSGSGECETHDHGGLRKNKLPGVTLVEVSGARLRTRPATGGALATLCADLAGLCSAEECARIRQLALAEPAA
jgi:hypothetical protein